MIVWDAIKNIKSDKKELRKFCLSFAIVLLLLGSIALWRGKSFFLIMYVCSVVSFLFALVCPYILLPLQKVLASILIILQYTVTVVVLIIVFYGLFTPISICAKVCKKGFLGDPIDRQCGSYWIPKEQKECAPELYERQF